MRRNRTGNANSDAGTLVLIPLHLLNDLANLPHGCVQVAALGPDSGLLERCPIRIQHNAGDFRAAEVDPDFEARRHETSIARAVLAPLRLQQRTVGLRHHQRVNAGIRGKCQK